MTILAVVSTPKYPFVICAAHHHENANVSLFTESLQSSSVKKHPGLSIYFATGST